MGRGSLIVRRLMRKLPRYYVVDLGPEQRQKTEERASVAERRTVAGSLGDRKV
jgi:hypothetical protein